MAKFLEERLLVIVEGPIASGKTTLLNNLEKRGFFTLKENCTEWQSFYGRNLLDCHYQDIQVKESWRRMGQGKPEHNTLLSGTRQFQYKVVSDYIKNYNTINKYNGLVIMERDLESVRDIFMPLNRDLLTFYDYLLLNDLVSNAEKILNADIPKLKIYLDINLTEGFSRMNQRGRAGEKITFNNYRKIWAAFDDFKNTCHRIISVNGLKEKEIAEEVQRVISEWVANQPSAGYQPDRVREEDISLDKTVPLLPNSVSKKEKKKPVFNQPEPSLTTFEPQEVLESSEDEQQSSFG